MSRGVNKVIIVGNLGADPEVRYMPNGTAVANIRLATNDGYKDKNTGQFVENTEWHRVVLFGRLGEIAGEYLRKGSVAYVEGRIRTNKWKDQQGQERYTTEIVADEMQLIGGNANAGGGSSNRTNANETHSNEFSNQESGTEAKAPAAKAKPKTAAAPAQNFDQSFDDDEIPF